MFQFEHIREAYERSKRAVRLRPAIARYTSTATCRVVDGFTCEATDGEFKLLTDAPESTGGSGRGPTPGFLLRAALGSCCAMGYIREAANQGVPINSIEVQVQTDADARGEFGLADVPCGFTKVRYIITVDSPAAAEDIYKIIEDGDDYAAILETVRDPVRVEREVRINQTVEA